jgi:hypothetical protein
LFGHGTYQYILVHTRATIYVIFLAFIFCCNLLDRLKEAHLLLPKQQRFQAQPKLLLRRFRALLGLRAPAAPPFAPLAFPGKDEAEGLRSTAGAQHGGGAARRGRSTAGAQHGGSAAGRARSRAEVQHILGAARRARSTAGAQHDGFHTALLHSANHLAHWHKRP